MSVRTRIGAGSTVPMPSSTNGSSATKSPVSAECWAATPGARSSAPLTAKSPRPSPSRKKAPSPALPNSRRMSSMRNSNRSLTYAQALYEATRQEMERDSGVFVFGLGVDDPKGMYGTTLDLHKLFGADRNFDTPLSEDAMTGVAIGAALAG